MDTNIINIKEYWDSVEDTYDISYEEFNIICRTPFKFIKKIISSGILKDIRLKYFGVFKVSSGRVKYSKKALQKNLERGVISQERYDRKIATLNNYVEKN